MNFTFHVVGLPHTSTVKRQSTCAYTQKVRRFANMMMGMGHKVFLYGGPENDAHCTDFVTLIGADAQEQWFGPNDYARGHRSMTWNLNDPWWIARNDRAIEEISRRIKPKDFIIVFDGNALPISQAFPNNMTVEAGIGYSHTFSAYRVFESYAWMHCVYGARAGVGGIMSVHGQNINDAVIYNSYEMDEYPIVGDDQGYYLFLARHDSPDDSKGLLVAQQVCKYINARLIIAGQGDPVGSGEFVGVVGPEEKKLLLSGARAMFCPSRFLEPFGGAHAEALLSGVPVISSDWGVFTETIQNGRNGYRCRTFKDYIQAAIRIEDMSRYVVAGLAWYNFSVEKVAPQYHAYFEGLMTLWGDGWYAGTKPGIIKP